jgi:uncharacterized protein (TIGR03435 family)
MRTCGIVQAWLFAFVSVAGLGQSQSRLAFEVASVKPAAQTNSGPPRGQVRGGPGTADPERLAIQGYSMFGLLLMAYDLKAEQISGPGWLQSEKYDIQAEVPLGATRAQFEVMLQTLLAERFGLKVHHESKDVDGYELIVAKGGPKLKTAEPRSGAPVSAAAAGPRGRGQLPKDKDGCLTGWQPGESLLRGWFFTSTLWENQCATRPD